MFNNPFNSFHDTVAEAKEEREQLDRLLTISTPRERLLVAVIAVFLVGLAAWLFLGSVARSVTVDGVLVEPQENPSEDNRSVLALVWIGSDVAAQIVAGMPAVVELAVTRGKAEALHGEVAQVTALAVSDGMAAFASTAPVSPRWFVITLDEEPDIASLAARKCRIVIGLGRQSPLALFGMRPS